MFRSRPFSPYHRIAWDLSAVLSDFYAVCVKTMPLRGLYTLAHKVLEWNSSCGGGDLLSSEERFQVSRTRVSFPGALARLANRPHEMQFVSRFRDPGRRGGIGSGRVILFSCSIEAAKSFSGLESLPRLLVSLERPLH